MLKTCLNGTISAMLVIPNKSSNRSHYEVNHFAFLLNNCSRYQ